MVAVSAPFGLRPIRSGTGGIIRPRGLDNMLASGYNTDILSGQVVRIDPSTRKIVPVTANNVDTIGVFDGVEFTDSTGRRRTLPNWIANTVATDIIVYVTGFDDPFMVYEVQADGPVPATKMGDETPLTNFSNGSTVTGYSAETCSATFVGTTVQSQLRCVGKGLSPDNDWGDAFTVIQVVMARHQQAAAKAAV